MDAAAADVRKLALDIRGRMGNDKPAVVVVVGASEGKPSVVVAVNDTAREWRLKAGELVRSAAGELGGNGGGTDDVAQGGGVPIRARPMRLCNLWSARWPERVTSS
jgi:alanyl-tRNA synthetase